MTDIEASGESPAQAPQTSISKKEDCTHLWVKMPWQEAYPASEGYKCQRCRSIELGWGQAVNPESLPKFGKVLSVDAKKDSVQSALRIETKDEALTAEVEDFAAKFAKLERRCKELALKNAELESCLRLIAMPQRPDGTWNRDRAACMQLAQSILES